MTSQAPEPAVVDEGRFVLQAYTSSVVCNYFQSNPSALNKLRSILLKTSDVAASLIPVEGARAPIKAILRGQIEDDFYPLSWVQNTIGPAIGRSWLLSAEQVESEMRYCLGLPHVDGETKGRLRDCLDDTILTSYQKVNQVAESFIASKGEMMQESMANKQSDEILPKYLLMAINEHFPTSQDFAVAFNLKYQGDRVLMGDYVVNCKKLSEVNANLTMASFNKELAPLVMTGLAQILLDN